MSAPAVGRVDFEAGGEAGIPDGMRHAAHVVLTTEALAQALEFEVVIGAQVGNADGRSAARPEARGALAQDADSEVARLGFTRDRLVDHEVLAPIELLL